ncbi:MAG: hypothetical protein OXE77_03550 [Flavobacteriaceae bacterium]|nr:hypothetical protein [Flavobacteriaceae bacterium]MCY4268300.1 hypothetical protein [Flavobacteriaceae bacterium]MCY4299392.1 hypothetical protein [Flavobacteriaceae bacterium]
MALVSFDIALDYVSFHPALCYPQSHAKARAMAWENSRNQSHRSRLPKVRKLESSHPVF